MGHSFFLVVLLVACGDNLIVPVDAAPPASDASFDHCKIQDESTPAPACDTINPIGEFTPEVQWAWTGPPGFTRSVVTPLVANLTDDNGDGVIDLCDTPDVVVVAGPMSGRPGSPGKIFVLDGRSGMQELGIDMAVAANVTPALGDMNHDGVADIVTVDQSGRVLVFDHTGALINGPGDTWSVDGDSPDLALADIDHDGEVEVIIGNSVFEHTGALRWSAGEYSGLALTTVVADLDGDTSPELIQGAKAYHADGTLDWDTSLAPGFAQVADLDADGKPEVLLTNRDGMALIDHDGHVQYSNVRTTPGLHGINAWLRPAVIADFDGDGTTEYALCSQLYFSAFDPATGIPRWNTPVSDQTGIAGATAFDFLGDGTMEFVFADEQQLYVIDSRGTPLYQIDRTSNTLQEYPIVADVDNDGAAEIVVTANTYPGLPQSPTVRVIRDRLDRWKPARRIWNQHTYHVTNVNEDGTIPSAELPAWRYGNKFRANAQLRNGRVCLPPTIE